MMRLQTFFCVLTAATLSTVGISTAIIQPVPVRAQTAVKNTVSAAPTPTPTPSPKPGESEVIEEDKEILKIDSEEVSLNLRVVDANNRSVAGLAEAQFQIYEDDVLQPITSLTVAEVPTVNALVIDNSRSLRAQLGKIIEAGKIIVGTNRPKDESAVIRFTSAEKIEVVQDFTPSKAALENALDNLFIEGGKTAVIDAVYQAARKAESYQNSQKKDDVKIRALVLVSDGDDRSSTHSEQQLIDLLRKTQVQIYAIGFIKDLSTEEDADGISRRAKAERFLTRLSQETGGKVYFPESMNELPQIAKEISGELRTQYLISYAPTNDLRDGKFRKIKVVVKDSGRGTLTAITRAGRTVSPN